MSHHFCAKERPLISYYTSCCQPSGPIENTLCAYETIEELNKRLYPELHGIVESNFFRYWKVSPH